jgi:integrase
MIYRRGKTGIYWLRFRFGGRIIHESTRTLSKTLVRRAELQRRRDLEERWNHIEKRALPPTVNEAAKTWLKKRAALSLNTRMTYQRALKHIMAFFGNLLVCEIEAQDISAYQKKRLSQNAAGASINKEIFCLSGILGDCGLWTNLRRDVKKLAENDEAGKVLADDEETRLLNCAARSGVNQGGWTPLYAVTVVGLNTGMRHKEIRTLRWKHLDLKNRVLKVSESKTEAGRSRPIPLVQPAWAALDMWASRFPDRKPDQFVFPRCENGRIEPERPIENWRTAWRKACSNADWLGYASTIYGILQQLSC